MPMLVVPTPWLSAVPTECQYSHRRITKAFVDGRLFGTWGLFHPTVFKQMGGRLGTGRGQLFEKNSDGQFVKVDG